MPKLKLLMLDACIVIKLHQMDRWDSLLERCDIHLSQVVVDESISEPDNENGYGDTIDLQPAIDDGRVSVFEVSVTELREFRRRFDANYMQDLDPGEAASLVHLTREQQEYLLCSADAIVFRVLGNMNLGEQGISLEEVLNRSGIGVNDLPWQYTKEFRDKYTKDGATDMIYGRGQRPST